jgi:hypothetical protein
LLRLYDACLRLDVAVPELDYKQSESSGADGEVEVFRSLGKPVFYEIDSLYEWARAQAEATI